MCVLCGNGIGCVAAGRIRKKSRTADAVLECAGVNSVALGTGCVYPKAVKTVANQLAAKGLTWRGYMQDMGNAAGERKRSVFRPTDKPLVVIREALDGFPCHPFGITAALGGKPGELCLRDIPCGFA